MNYRSYLAESHVLAKLSLLYLHLPTIITNKLSWVCFPNILINQLIIETSVPLPG